MPVNQVYKATGEKIIDISDSTVTAADLAEGVTAYDATGEKITGTGKLDDTILYGIRIDQNESDPASALIYLEDAVGMTPAYMETVGNNYVFNYGSWENAFFMPKPCMLKFDGTVDYYLDPNDYTKKVDGTASDVANTSYQGNAMMEFPQIFVKVEIDSSGRYIDIYISNKNVDGSYKCYSNIDKNSHGIDKFYIGIYAGCIIDNKLRSLSGQQPLIYRQYGSSTYYNLSLSDCITRAYNNNNNYDYSIDLISDKMLTVYLLYLMCKTRDLDSAIGRSNSDGNIYNTGAANAKGLFGKTYYCLKVLGIEDYCGYRPFYIAGLTKAVASIPNKFLTKFTYSTFDGSSNNGYDSYNNYKQSPYTDTDANYGYIKRMKVIDNFLLIPNPTYLNGSDTTYYCAYVVRATSSGSSGCMLYYITRGGNYGKEQYLPFLGEAKSFTSYTSYSSAFDAGKQYGARLSCKPART